MSKLVIGNSKLESRNSLHGPQWAGRLSDLRGLVTHWATGLTATMIVLLAASPVFAQGCALCYNTASAAGSKGIAALRNGILILMIPPVIIFGVVCFFTLRGRNRFNDVAEDVHRA